MNYDILKPITQSTHSNCDVLKQDELKNYLQDINISEFPIEWKKGILDLIPRRIRQEDSIFINSIVEEIKKIYIENMKDFVWKSIVSCKPCIEDHTVCEDCDISTSLKKKIIKEDIMYNHSTFLKHRSLFARRYVLSYSIIRHVVNIAHCVLPVVICDFTRYRKLGIVSLSVFQDIVFKDIKKNALIITNQFHAETFKAVNKLQVLKNISMKRFLQLMQCLTNVFTQQILNLMMRSINHIINIMKDAHSCPQIQFQLICKDDQLTTEPPLEQVFLTYHNIIDNIKAIAKDLTPLEEALNINANEKYMKIALPDWFLKNCRNNMQEMLDALFRPINDYVASVSAEFSSVCTSNAMNKISSLTSKQVNFDVYVAHIHKYSEYLSKVNSMISNLYYIVGKLEQFNAKETLKKICYDVTNILTAKLVKYHQDFNHSICSDFEDMKFMALDIPNDAESLIQLGEYMSRASRIIIEELKQRIQQSIYMLSKLMDITILTDEHISLNKSTVNWLHDIQPIFVQSNTLCEAMKSELEEDLQRRINGLNSEVDVMFPQLIILDKMDDISRIGEYMEHYKDLIKKYNSINSKMEVINSEERLFKFPETEFPKVTELKETIVPFYSLICTIYEWRRNYSVWLNGPFDNLDSSMIEKKTVNYFDEITEINKTMRSRIKMDVTTSRSYKFSGIADDPDPMQQPAPLKLCWQALNNVNEFKIYLPLAACMCNPALETRHWREMSMICNLDLTPNTGTTLKKMIDMNLMDNIEKYKTISLGANKELRLQQDLAEMIKQWQMISFEMHIDEHSDIVSFKYIDDIETLLGEHLVKIEEMRVSHFVKPVLSDVSNFFVILTKIQESLEQWTCVQLRKLSLQTIFTYPEIGSRLKQETSLYLDTTKILLEIEKRFAENTSFNEFDKSLNSSILNKINERLERVSKGVKDYLDVKRLSFVRFFFLTDTEIQGLLFESNNLLKRCALLNKCFAGIDRLKLDKFGYIKRIIGHCEESLRLNNSICMTTENNCEESWLLRIEKEMCNAIRVNIFQYQTVIAENLVFIPFDHFPSMTIVCALQLDWTSSVEKCFSSSNVDSLKSLLVSYIDRIASLTDRLKKKLSRRHRNISMSLIVLTCTHKEILNSLLYKDINERTNFEWIAQLKYYSNGRDIEVSMFNATVKYGYEYSYYQQNIINTPLTDRCFRTIMQAYHYHLYGGIIGPTCVGKTTTIQSIIRALAKAYYVVDCNSNISYDLLAQTFKGVVCSGAWICLESFDKLRVELLSAIAQNLNQMRQFISSNLKSVNFEGYSLKPDISGNVCVSISPGLSAYTNLPDNLKILFRMVSMITPDMKKIAEIQLFIGGFIHSKGLSSKLIVTYELLSEHLGIKCNYNFSVSSMKTVIANAINMKMNLPEEDEYALLLRSIIDINVPQLHTDDVPSFQSIMQDVYPECKAFPFDYSAILNTLEDILAAKSFTSHKVFRLKAIQIFELMYVHRALMLVGDPLVGKTEIVHALADTLSSLDAQGSKIGAKVKLETVLPDVIDNDGLFGYFCDKSGIWKDGLCAAILRRFAEDMSTDRKWLVLDGSMTGSWVENFYTVLDENKTLYLASGERLVIPLLISVIFETVSMLEISPGLISRCGIIYIDSDAIGWRPYMLSHIAKHDIYNEHDDILHVLFDWTIEPCLNFLKENDDIYIRTNQELPLVVSLLNLFEMILKSAYEETEDESKENHFVIWAQAALISATIWGLAGNLIGDAQIRFNTFCVSLWSGVNVRYPKPDAIKHLEVTLPNEGLIQDNFYIFQGIGHWKYWGDVLKTEKIPEICDFDHIYIPSIDNLKYTNLFIKHIWHRKPFLLHGDVAVGKTCLIRNLLNCKIPKNCLANFFSFTSMLSVTKTEKLLISKLNRIRGRKYGPGKNQYCVNFIDDVSSTIMEKDEAQYVFELLRQIINYGYFYDAVELNKVFVQDTTFALAFRTGKIDNKFIRFLRHFNTYTIPAPTTDGLFRICSNVLLANLKKNSFAADVTGSVTSMVNAAIDVYKSVIGTLRPTPVRLYYAFDAKDIFRVISGCSLIQKESVETKITFVRLWTHEVSRVFGDRVLDTHDREWLFTKIRDAVKSNFKESFDIAFDHLPKFENNQITADSFRDLVFGNFTDAEKNSKCRRYEEIGSLEILRNRIHTHLRDYNSKFDRRIDIVASRYFLESLIRISRILSTPCGNMLMISTVGSGRRTVTLFAALVQQQSFFETPVRSCYDAEEWRGNLRTILRECGTSRKDVTYFMSEQQMTDTFLSDISCLLSTGELADLFSVEDRRNIIETTRLHAQGGDGNAEISSRSVMAYFVNQCRNRLHFVLGFSPTNRAFRTYLCSYPNLAKHCTVNYCQEWPKEALLEIACKHMERIDIPDEIMSHAARTCVQFHDSVKERCSKYREMFGRVIHVTPTAFLHMLKLYAQLTSKKQVEIVATRDRYLAGLQRLELAAEQVERMKATLTLLKPQLELSAQQTVITMKEVENENVSVERATILVKQEEEIANRKAAIAGTLRSECEAELAVAIPILEDALVALNTLKPTDITLVKAMKNPPDTVKLVMAAVCVMLEVPPDRTVDPVTGKKYTDYWGPSKRILGDMNFLQNLRDYDKDNITPSVMQIIKRTYMTDGSFTPNIVAKASSAAEGLCKWVRAMVSYDEVAKVVLPKKKKLAAAQVECDEAEAFLNEKRQTLAALNAKLAALNDSLRQTLQKKLDLETEVAACTAKLIKAEKLIASLGGEKSRWMECASNLQTSYDNLAGDMLLSCGTIAYLAPYNIAFRDELLKEWQSILETSEIPYTRTYELISVLGVEIEIDYWQLCGLSKNRFAVENAIILKNSEQWCLFIDSQNQMNRWIRKIEEKNHLSVVKSTDSDYVSIIEGNTETGVPVLLENVGERLDIALEPILRKCTYHKNGAQYIYIGRRDVTYSDNFRLYITTRLSNPNYTADVFSKLTIIDFSMPNGTLRDKLLDIVVSKERPELQEKFELLRVQDAANKKILQQQEDNILRTLSSTATNILEDENAIRILDTSKNVAVDITSRQETARIMVRDINMFRDAYLPFTDHCAELFCTLSSLSNLNHMYRFSFTWFIQLYITSIETSSRSIILAKRLNFLKCSFTRSLHSSVCRSLFSQNKLLYSFLLCVRVLIDTGEATREEIDFFTSAESRECEAILEEGPVWIPSDIWRRICRLSKTLPAFHDLAMNILADGTSWKRYYSAVPFQSDHLPVAWAKSLTRFQRLILVRVIRRDKMIAEITLLTEDTMGEVFDTCPNLQVSKSYAESNCLTPIIFILPCYSSPLSLIGTYAATKGYTSKFFSLSIGDGQWDKVEALIEQARSEGGWIFLQNCHHAVARLPRLEQICENLSVSGASLDFRLWLSCCSIPEFPIGVLQNSVKIAHDSPLRLKQNLLMMYRSEPVADKEFFDSCPGKDKEFSKLLYGLCFFHAIVRERRYFGPQGWNIPYDFGHDDFVISAMQMRDLINENEGIPFDSLTYLVGECNYGGKVEDEIDRRCLRSLLDPFCNASVIDHHDYSFSDGVEHTVPRRCEYRDVVLHISNIRVDNSMSEALASDENASITRDDAVALEFIKSTSLLNRIKPAHREIAYDRALERVNDINDRLPDLFNTQELRYKYPALAGELLNAVLLREVELINRTIVTIVTSLSDLRSALNGESILTEHLEDFCKEICNNEAPRIWRSIDIGFATTRLTNYMKLLSNRAKFLRDWCNDGLPRFIFFDALFYRRAFLSAALIAFARRHNVPVEQVAQDLRVTRKYFTCDEEDKDTYYIHGLRLSGARWDVDRHALTESLANVFWYEMPPVRLTFVEERKIVDEVYDCPVYISPARRSETDANTNAGDKKSFIAIVPLETDLPHVHWIKRATALFCQIEK